MHEGTKYQDGAEYVSPRVLAEGKTKRILEKQDDPTMVILVSKDDITAGDGAKHDLMHGKAMLANETACNVFRLLKDCGLPVAFDKQESDVSFSAPRCQMLPYEVVVRREAHGSYLKRNPTLEKGHLFPNLLVEIFLKTKDRKWKDHDLVCDDPYIMFGPKDAGKIAGQPPLQFDDKLLLFEPGKPLQEPFLTLALDEVYTSHDERMKLFQMQLIAKQAFLVLEKAWQLEGRILVDFKVEFGLTFDGRLLLADVIDNDSWRVLENGLYIDKQSYRDGGKLGDVFDNYRRVAKITWHFHVPVQQVVILTGSLETNLDDVAFVKRELEHLTDSAIRIKEVLSPDDPVEALLPLVHEVPDTVVIALDKDDEKIHQLIGSTIVPVIYGKRPINPAMTAIKILAARNPYLYMVLRSMFEEWFENLAD